MKCPRCDTLINNNKICPKCNERVYVINKALNASYKMYNEALKLAIEKDYSSAIIILKKSLYFNKSNIFARNLLGILYYQVGNFSEATKHWIISTNIDKNKENRAFYYIDVLKKNIRKFEKLNKSSRLYNQALRHLKRKNDDLAVISLKKALGINKKFVDGLNLLALCYILQKKYKNAEICLQKALKIDVKNKISIGYLEEINKKNKKYKKKEKKEKEQEQFLVFEEQYNTKKDKKSGIYSFVLGGIIVALFIYYLVMPDYMSKSKEKIENLNVIIKEEEKTSNILKNEANEMKNNISLLQKENENIKKQLQIYIDKENISVNIKKIDQALRLYKKGQYEDAKIVMKSINTKGFDENILKKYENAKKKIIK